MTFVAHARRRTENFPLRPCLLNLSDANRADKDARC